LRPGTARSWAASNVAPWDRALASHVERYAATLNAVERYAVT
jgi:hypothetical protein